MPADAASETTPNMIPVTILAPAFDEEEVIEDFVSRSLAEMPADWELLLVNDGSTDKTAEILRDLSARDHRLSVVHHETNRGIGAALSTGFASAMGEIVVTMDADLSHPFQLVHRLVGACRDADAAFGSRFVPGGGMRDVPLGRILISRAGNLVFRTLFWTRLRDFTTGMRAYRRDVIREIPLDATGFDVQFEIAVRLLSRRRRIVEVPMLMTSRAAGESKMRYSRLLPIYAKALIRMLLLRWKGSMSNRVLPD